MDAWVWAGWLGGFGLAAFGTLMDWAFGFGLGFLIRLGSRFIVYICDCICAAVAESGGGTASLPVGGVLPGGRVCGLESSGNLSGSLGLRGGADSRPVGGVDHELKVWR